MKSIHSRHCERSEAIQKNAADQDRSGLLRYARNDGCGGKQLVILAGGLGTRLRERLGDLPKPMISIAGVPLLERQILLAKRYQFQKVLILVNYQADIITNFCQSKNNWDLAITLVDEGTPAGTAGALLNAYDHLENEFLLMYGDTMLDVDLDRFYQFHAQHAADATLFLHPNDHPYDSDLVEMNDDGKINCFHPCPHDPERNYPNLVNAALYWIKKDALAAWRFSLEKPADIAKKLFPCMLQSGQCLSGYRSTEYIKDIGTPERLDKVTADFLSGKITRANLNYAQPAIFLDRDGVINHEVHHLTNPQDFVLLPNAAAAIRQINQSSYRAVVITNQPVIARGECSEADLTAIHHKMETCLGKEKAYLDQIYYCPHHPDAGFAGERPDLKIRCDCRKPNLGMIAKAQRELMIALESSWLIGDSSTDMLTAQRAGVRSIGVMTGHACLDNKFHVTPDYEVTDLATAVHFILHDYPVLCRQNVAYAETIEPGDLIAIAGLSKSGKTTWTMVLRDLLRQAGKKVVVISLDRWIKSSDERSHGVLGRYDMPAIEQMMMELKQRKEKDVSIDLPFYDRLQRKQIQQAETMVIKADTIVLLEGVVALLAESIRSAVSKTFFIETDEAVRKQRVAREYERRGEIQDKIDQIYEQREQDETPVVCASREFAAWIISCSMAEKIIA